MANSYEAVARVAITDPDLRSAVYEDADRAEQSRQTFVAQSTTAPTAREESSCGTTW